MAKPDLSRAHAQKLDAEPAPAHFRSEFIIPSKADLQRTAVSPSLLPTQDLAPPDTDSTSIYLCGNSLGLQPRLAAAYVQTQLATWATQGVHGHFKHLDSPLPPWMDIDEAVATPMAALVGAAPSEVAVMQTLTANLHLLMASFYRPTRTRYKIILEAKAFPSDHFVVQSQLAHHGVAATDGMLLISPPDPSSPLLSTAYILSIIDANAHDTALLLLPGIQFYTGQLFDIKTITAHARAKGITVGWDLAHAAGNVPLELHDWDVDFAAWCTYKYLNSGPGATGGLFVHDKHTSSAAMQPRLQGWWGSSKTSRFNMDNSFDPIPGAQGFQLSNPSALDLSAVAASMALFSKTSIHALRQRSLELTTYTEALLDNAEGPRPYSIITPRDPEARGAQLSVLLEPGLLDTVMRVFDQEGVVVDERKPDVIRVAPAPIYNNFEDCWRFCDVLQRALKQALEAKANGN